MFTDSRNMLSEGDEFDYITTIKFVLKIKYPIDTVAVMGSEYLERVIIKELAKSIAKGGYDTEVFNSCNNELSIISVKSKEK